MDDCIFCKIAKNEIKAQIVLEDRDWVCFKDLNPKAPVHLLLIPRKHYTQLHQVDEDSVYASLFAGIRKVVLSEKLEENGYRVVTNTGRDGGQTVNHLHFHILAKRSMGWPPG